MPRVSLIVILVMYVCYLYSINCPTVVCLPSMLYLSYGETPLVNCGPRSNFLYIALPFYFTRTVYYLALLLSYYHSIRSFICLQQTGEIDNLIVSWEQSTCLCCAGFTLLLGEDTPTTSFLAPLSGVSRSSQASPSEVWLSPTGPIKPWFHNWGKTCYCAYHTFLLGFPTGCTYKPSNASDSKREYLCSIVGSCL
jgi:hypothetical protein